MRTLIAFIADREERQEKREKTLHNKRKLRNITSIIKEKQIEDEIGMLICLRNRSIN